MLKSNEINDQPFKTRLGANELLALIGQKIHCVHQTAFFYMLSTHTYSHWGIPLKDTWRRERSGGPEWSLLLYSMSLGRCF